MGEEEADEDEEDEVERDSGSDSGSSSVSASTTVFVFFAFFVFFGFGSARFSTLVSGVRDVLVPGAVGMGGEDTRGLEKAWMESTEFIFEGEVE